MCKAEFTSFYFRDQMAKMQFEELCSILDTLLGPNGCPWDKEQTLETLRTYVLEEVCELIDALHERDMQNIKEELGDLFFTVVFLAKVAAKEGHFTLEDALQAINEKLIRRHPHIFGSAGSLDTSEQVLAQWEVIKKQEKTTRKSALDAVSKSLPSLERVYKMLSRMKKAGFVPELVVGQDPEELLGQKLFVLAKEAADQGLHAELALRKVCQQVENAFLEWETCNQS